MRQAQNLEQNLGEVQWTRAPMSKILGRGRIDEGANKLPNWPIYSEKKSK